MRMSNSRDVEHYGDKVVRGQQRQIEDDDIIVRCTMSLALSTGDGFFLINMNSQYYNGNMHGFAIILF